MFLMVEPPIPSMFYFLILAFIGGLIFLIFTFFIPLINLLRDKEKFADGDIEYCICMSIFTIVCILGIIWCICAINHRNKERDIWYSEYHEEVVYNEIYSVTRENEVEGHFTLGCGSINTDTYYYFYIQTEPNVYRLTKLKVDGNTYIKEVNDNFNIIAVNPENSFTIKYYVNVPKGTIIKSYNV